MESRTGKCENLVTADRRGLVVAMAFSARKD